MRFCALLLCATAILLGIFFRFHNLGQRTPFEDEAMTWLRTSGYTQAELNDRLYDGRTHTVEELRAFQTPHPEHGVGTTLAVLAHDDPQHAPIYFLLEHLSSRYIGNTLTERRALSVFAGILFIGLFAWLCRTLFSSTRAALIGASLVALSPLHIAYAQQAREYALWAALVCAWSIALIDAARRGTISSWILYAGASAAALYVSLFSLPVLLAHGVWICVGKEHSSQRKRFFIAAGAALLAYTPWLANLLVHRQNALDENVWSGGVWPWSSFLQKWAFNLSATFFDLLYVNMRYAAISAFVLLLTAFACLDLSRRATRESTLFIGCLAAASAGMLLIPDLLFHQHRSAEARYVLPCFIALQLAVVGSLAGAGCTPRERLLRCTALTILLALGAWSGYVRSTHSSWWDTNKDAALPAIADALNAHPGAEIAAEDGTVVLALLNILDPSIRVHMIDTRSDAWSAQVHRGIYVLAPSDDLQARLERKGYHLQRILADASTHAIQTFRTGAGRSVHEKVALALLR
jgi:uncharacterized membrane protein